MPMAVVDELYVVACKQGPRGSARVILSGERLTSG